MQHESEKIIFFLFAYLSIALTLSLHDRTPEKWGNKFCAIFGTCAPTQRIFLLFSNLILCMCAFHRVATRKFSVESASLCIGHSTYKNTKMADKFFSSPSFLLIKLSARVNFVVVGGERKKLFTFRTICEVVKLCVTCKIE